MNLKFYLANYVSLFLLLALTADALVANWRLDPIWNLLYTRIQMNLFYNSHPISILAICTSAYYMIIRHDNIPTAVFAAFGTASIHELTLDGVDIMVFRQDSGISIGYGSILLVFLVVGIVFTSKRYHKTVWLVTFIMMFLWFVILTSLPHFSTIDPNVPFGASKDFYNPLANIEEVFSWLIPAGLWFLPRAWFDR